MVGRNRVAVEFGFDDYPRWPRKLGNLGLMDTIPSGLSEALRSDEFYDAIVH